jgi:hypothetical protein
MNKMKSAKLPQGGACRPGALMNTAYRQPSANPLCALLISIIFVASSSIHAQSTGIYVNSSNNVGIGTTNPQVPLQIHVGTNQNIFFDSNSGESRISIVNDAFNANPNIRFQAAAYNFLGASGAGPYLTINSSGNVGIGTTSPASDSGWASPALDISGTRGTAVIRTTSASGIATLRMTGPSANHIDDWAINMYAGNSSTFSIFPQAGNIGPALTITNTGNVGICAATPGTKLEIDQNGTAYNIGYGGWWSGFRTSAQTGVFGFNQDDRACIGLGGNVYNRGFSANSMGIMNGSTTAEDIYLINQNGPGAGFMVLKASGNVGIDTSSPGYTLDVNGQVHASSFVASSGNNYADFVFKPGYKLPPLSDVEASIKKDGHLPGIPSEAEAKANGIDLASMQVKLLQKIEELTLHQIDEEKRIEQLEKENAELREKLTK